MKIQQFVSSTAACGVGTLPRGHKILQINYISIMGHVLFYTTPYNTPPYPISPPPTLNHFLIGNALDFMPLTTKGPFPLSDCDFDCDVTNNWILSISMQPFTSSEWNIKEKFCDRNRSVGMDHKLVHSVDKNSNQLQLSITPGLILSLCLLRWPRNKVMIHKYFIHTCNIIVICIISIHCTMLSPSHL